MYGDLLGTILDWFVVFDNFNIVLTWEATDTSEYFIVFLGGLCLFSGNWCLLLEESNCLSVYGICGSRGCVLEIFATSIDIEMFNLINFSRYFALYFDISIYISNFNSESILFWILFIIAYIPRFSIPDQPDESNIVDDLHNIWKG